VNAIGSWDINWLGFQPQPGISGSTVRGAGMPKLLWKTTSTHLFWLQRAFKPEGTLLMLADE
jgi:hypothetical protein